MSTLANYIRDQNGTQYAPLFFITIWLIIISKSKSNMQKIILVISYYFHTKKRFLFEIILQNTFREIRPYFVNFSAFNI